MSAFVERDVVVLDNGGTNVCIGHLRNGVPSPGFQTISTKTLLVNNVHQVLSTLIQEYVNRLGLELSAVVLGIPGMLNHSDDSISHCNNIPQLDGSGLRASLESSLGCRVILEQDIMLQVLGEWRAGAAKNCNSVFGVYFGTGIGAAYLLDGNPYHRSVSDLQAGHIPIMAEGKLCPCGNRDCIEAYANGHILLELAKANACPIERLFEERDSPELKQSLDQFVLYQAYMLATVVTLIGPELILIGGGIPSMKNYPREQLLSKAREHVQKPYPSDATRFAWATLGSESPLYGATALLDLDGPNS